jgi:dTDP-4-dehydrorhamnose reductase
MRVLIIGGSGQVGTALQRVAISRAEVIAPGSRELDVRSKAEVESAFAKYRPDAVVNAAAYTAVDRAEDEPDLAWRTNAEGAGHIASACKHTGAYLIHLSTDYVFDGTKTGAYVESDATNPQSVYGRSKLAGENAALATWQRTLVLRVSWVFSDSGANFVKTILRLARGGGELKVVDDQWGTPCPARAISDVILELIARHERGSSLQGIYHFATRPVTNWFAFAREVVVTGQSMGLLPKETSIRAITTREFAARAPRPSNSVLDSTRLCRAIGVEAPDWRDDVRWTLERLASTIADG